MVIDTKKYKNSVIFKAVAMSLILSFGLMSIAPNPALAQGALSLPVPGTAVPLSASFAPAMLRGLKAYPDNPLKFDFIVDSGNTGLGADSLKSESGKLAKYFLASLTTPEEDLWVNLSPYENDRIIPDALGQTEMGRDLLAQDYILKQITASLILPDSETGKDFWQKVYKKAYEEYGTTNIPVDTFNKVWIMPDKAVIYEDSDKAFITESHLKVMLEEDYVAKEKGLEGQRIKGAEENQNETQPLNTNDQQLTTRNSSTSTLSSSIVREVVLPLLEKEVNEGKNFSQLRQIYHAMILATWYKQTLKDSIINKVYSDKKKVKGLEAVDSREHVVSSEKSLRNTNDQILDTNDYRPNTVQSIYNQYLAAYKKGVCNFIKVEQDQYVHKPIARKYFSGGFGRAGSSVISSSILRKPIHALSVAAASIAVGLMFFANVVLAEPSQSSLGSMKKDLPAVQGVHAVGADTIPLTSPGIAQGIGGDTIPATPENSAYYKNKALNNIEWAFRYAPELRGAYPDWADEQLRWLAMQNPIALYYYSNLKDLAPREQWLEWMKQYPDMVLYNYSTLKDLATPEQWLEWMKQVPYAALESYPFLKDLASREQWLEWMKKEPDLVMGSYHFPKDLAPREQWFEWMNQRPDKALEKYLPFKDVLTKEQWLELIKKDPMSAMGNPQTLKDLPTPEERFEVMKEAPGHAMSHYSALEDLLTKEQWLELMKQRPLKALENYPSLKDLAPREQWFEWMKRDLDMALYNYSTFKDLLTEEQWLELMKRDPVSAINNFQTLKDLPTPEEWFEVMKKVPGYALSNYSTLKDFLTKEQWLEFMNKRPDKALERYLLLKDFLSKEKWLELMKRDPVAAIDNSQTLKDLAPREQWLEWMNQNSDVALENYSTLKDLAPREQWFEWMKRYPLSAMYRPQTLKDLPTPEERFEVMKKAPKYALSHYSTLKDFLPQEQWLELMKQLPNMALENYSTLKDLAPREQWLEWMNQNLDMALYNYSTFKDLATPEQWLEWMKRDPVLALKFADRYIIQPWAKSFLDSLFAEHLDPESIYQKDFRAEEKSILFLAQALIFRQEGYEVSAEQKEAIIRVFAEIVMSPEKFTFWTSNVSIDDKNKILQSAGFSLAQSVVNGQVNDSISEKVLWLANTNSEIGKFMRSTLYSKAKEAGAQDFAKKLEAIIKKDFPTSFPYEDYFKDGKLTVRAYFLNDMFSRAWKKSFLDTDFTQKPETITVGKTVFQRYTKLLKIKDGRTIALQFDVAPVGDFGDGMFSTAADLETDMIVYAGHTGGGAALATSIHNAPQDGAIRGRNVTIILQSCSSYPNYYGMIKKLYPDALMIGTEELSTQPDRPTIFKAILRGMLNLKDFAEIRESLKNIPAETVGGAGEIPFENTVFPDDFNRIMQFSDSDGDGVMDPNDTQYDLGGAGTTQTFDDFEFRPNAQAPAQNLIELYNYIYYRFSPNPFLQHFARAQAPLESADGFRNKGWFRDPQDKKDAFRITDISGYDQLRFQVEVNAGYSLCSMRVLKMMAMYELYDFFSRHYEVVTKGGQSLAQERVAPLDEMTPTQRYKAFMKAVEVLSLEMHAPGGEASRDLFAEMYAKFIARYQLPAIGFDVANTAYWSKEWAGDTKTPETEEALKKVKDAFGLSDIGALPATRPGLLEKSNELIGHAVPQDLTLFDYWPIGDFAGLHNSELTYLILEVYLEKALKGNPRAEDLIAAAKYRLDNLNHKQREPKELRRRAKDIAQGIVESQTAASPIAISSPLGEQESSSLADAARPGADNGLGSTTNGGIDFNAANLELKRTGSSPIEFNLPPEWQGVDLENISGFTPVIMGIIPIMDFKGFLGLGEGEALGDENNKAENGTVGQTPQPLVFKNEERHG